MWQAQLGIPLGDRDAYMKALTLAFGEQCYNDIIESQLMIAHTKEIGDSFPDAFLSNAKLIALRRKHKKHKKQRITKRRSRSPRRRSRTSRGC